MKTLVTILVSLFIINGIFAQVPEKFSYQAVIRNSANTLLTNTNVGIQVSILQGSATGTPVYVERHTATTNANGLVSISIGTGTPVTGVFAGINWGSGTYFIKTETDPAGGNNYSITGTSQLMSVPYALYAKNVKNNDDADASPTNEIQSLSINGNQLSISDGNTVTLPTSGGGTPGGSNGNIQFNNTGSFYGENELFWNSSENRLGIGTSTPEAPLTVLHDGTAYRRGLVVKSTSSFSAIYADAADGDAAVLFLKYGELKWNTRNNPEFGNDNYQILEISGPGVVHERMRIERSTGKVVFNGAVEVKNGKGIIRSIDNIQRKNLTTTVTVNTTINAGSTAQISFTFPESFTAVPVVYIGNAAGGGFAEVVMTVAAVTTTGGKIFVYNPKTTSQTPNFTVNVVALGQE